jgi:hypothetical protein
MHKALTIIAVTLSLVLLFCVSCAPSVVKEDFDKVKADLETAKDQVKTLQQHVGKLSAMSAYWMWVDQYYSGGVTYQFADKESFYSTLGTLVKATNDPDSLKAWEYYMAASTNLDNVVKSLPADYKTWDKDQTAKWTKAKDDAWALFAKVGTPLYNVIIKK